MEVSYGLDIDAGQLLHLCQQQFDILVISVLNIDHVDQAPFVFWECP